MVKRSFVIRDSQLKEGEGVFSEAEQGLALSLEDTTVHLVLLRDTKLTCVGEVTGLTYTFDGAGSTVPVDYWDAQSLLKRNRPVCCGGNSSSMFEILAR